MQLLPGALLKLLCLSTTYKCCYILYKPPSSGVFPISLFELNSALLDQGFFFIQGGWVCMLVIDMNNLDFWLRMPATSYNYINKTR